ncbi:protein translocase subunit SecD [Streptomyces sp. SID3212]|uniref:protein translocase subunit SecD n=1 Tax=unclassified Streptomyces TaxID=2593676 RepID=UPI00136D2AD7|nr:protein translocase subunit SecD [Streptomyces sp. SID3212]
MAAPNKGRRQAGSPGRPGRTLALFLIAMVALTGGMFWSGHVTPRLGIDLAGGTSITLQAKNTPGKPNAINKTNMDTAVNIIDRRVNGLGVSEAEVQTQGDKNIIVNIPKGTNSKQAQDQVGTTAQLFFRPVLTYAPGTPTAPEPAPSTSPSGSAKPSASGKPQADSSKSSTPSPSSTTQGRAVTDALKKAPTPTPTPGASDAPPAATTPPDPAATTPPDPATAALEKKFTALDCRDEASRTTVNQSSGPKDTIVACGQDTTGKNWDKYILGPAELDGTDVSKAKGVLDQQRGMWIVQMDFTGGGTKKFQSITGKLSQQQPPMNQFAIVLDGNVVSAPSVSQTLGASAEISGSFDQESAQNLGNILSFGALPLSFDVASTTTVTAALGGEQLHAGLIAGAIGLGLVIIYLVAYYRGLSLIAILSLGASAIMTYTIMSLLGPGIGFALNLPAVCGAIVAIGITADSFIVYFERVRDEIREGRTLRPAVERAWPRARRTILVSDFVSFLAAAVLFVVTVGKVQGFAFTLGLTTVLDVVVVFFFTKPVMTLMARKKFFAEGHSWSGLDPKRLGAKPPLRRSRPNLLEEDPPEPPQRRSRVSAAPTDSKEA